TGTTVYSAAVPKGTTARRNTYPPAHPVSRDTLAHEIDVARTVAMWDHTRVRHAIAEGVLTLLDVAWIDARRYHPYTHFPGTGSGIGHLADLQYLPRRSLLFVPRCAHLEPRCKRNSAASVSAARHQFAASSPSCRAGRIP